MSQRPAPGPDVEGSFAAIAAHMSAQPLHEICPGAPGVSAAAWGFALGLAAGWAGPAGVFWVGEEGAFAEEGAPYPPGLARFGLDLSRLIVVRAPRREDALWAAEQGLAAAGAVVVCALGAQGRPLELKASRRLLLCAERNRSKCLLVWFEGGASAAWSRWRVTPAPSLGRGRELGLPAWRVERTRNRAGPAGAIFTLEWNAHAHAFTERGAMACDLSAAPFGGSAEAMRTRAG